MIVWPGLFFVVPKGGQQAMIRRAAGTSGSS